VKLALDQLASGYKSRRLSPRGSTSPRTLCSLWRGWDRPEQVALGFEPRGSRLRDINVGNGRRGCCKGLISGVCFDAVAIAWFGD